MIVENPGAEDSEEWSAAGMSHAFALEWEQGRVYLLTHQPQNPVV